MTRQSSCRLKSILEIVVAFGLGGSPALAGDGNSILKQLKNISTIRLILFVVMIDRLKKHNVPPKHYVLVPDGGARITPELNPRFIHRCYPHPLFRTAS